MKALLAFYGSSIGKKLIVAVTGIFLILFVVGHMLGNLQIFLGPDWINAYAYKLQSLGPLLWVIRLGLLAIVGAHILTTVLLTIQNRHARPERYAVSSPTKSTLASRTMVLSGLILVAFIVFHLLHYTVRAVPGHAYNSSIIAADGFEFPAHIELDKKWGLALADTEPHPAHNTFGMMVAGFSFWYISGFYLLAMFLLCLHLSHGVSSVPQTLGLRNDKVAGLLSIVGIVLSWGLFAGFAAIPIAVMLGFGR